jgi:glycosyltransferase involved in cell wall biosynthesis
MASDFQVIIASYNRKENIVKLVSSILQCEPCPRNVIVVDATEEENVALRRNKNVLYFHGLKHKNQPYQRLVGAYAADTEKIIFLDDDLEILDKNIFGKLLQVFENEEVVAVTASIIYENSRENDTYPDFFLFKFMLFLTGRPILGEGKIGLTGHVGKIKASISTNSEFLHGPLMGFKRSIFLQLPDLLMLNLFDQKMAIPEDKILSIRALRYGSLMYLPEGLVLHPRIESTYFKSIADYTARVHFSRLLINMELAGEKGYIIRYLYILHFKYYSFWRKVIALIRSIFNPELYLQKYKGFRTADKWGRLLYKGKINIDESIIRDARSDSTRYS